MTPSPSQCSGCTELKTLQSAVDRANEKLDVIDLALRGDSNGRAGIIEQVRQLNEWKEGVEQDIEKKDQDSRQIKTALIGAIIITLLGLVGTAFVAGLKQLGWLGHPAEIGSK